MPVMIATVETAITSGTTRTINGSAPDFPKPIFKSKENTTSIAKVTEVIASATKSFDDALESGITRASKTPKGISGACIADQKVVVTDGKISEYRVEMTITFLLED